jgi:TetR/AcrR family transcriptional repressor of nem operon
MPKQSAAKETVSQKQDTKTLLLEAGTEIMLEKGYTNTGIMEVLQKVGVPKGSFYYYFESKEEFGLQIINKFDECIGEKLSRLLCDKAYRPVQRLRNYCQEGRQFLAANKCRKGCLIGNLSQEMADQSEVLRARLEEVLTKWRNRMAACIKEGQTAGEISKDIDTVDLAEFFLSGWEGAVMRAKTTKNTGPQDAFMRVMFDHVLKNKR